MAASCRSPSRTAAASSIWRPPSGCGGGRTRNGCRPATRSAGGAAITALLAAKGGGLWAGSDGPFLFSLAGRRHRLAPAWPLPGWRGGRVRALAEDQKGRIWAGGLQGGLASGRETFTVWNEDNGLHRDGILALLADREGSLWISLNGHGLQQWLGESWTHRNRWRGDPGGQPAPSGFRHQRKPRTAASTRRSSAAASGIGTAAGCSEYGSEAGLSEDVRYAYEPAPGELWVGARYGIFERRPALAASSRP